MKNPVQFGIVREDYLTETEVIRRFNLKNALLVASGGCTALHLKTIFPNLNLTVFDFNPHQIALVKAKIETIKTNENYAAVINKTLNLSGNFESLFNGWRHLLNEFILDQDETHELFANFMSESVRTEKILKHPYWPVSFDLFFHESILKTMFGEAAIQHAPRGTYPRYFQKAFERGLLASDYLLNPYLQHLFCGRFLTFEGYLANPPKNLEMKFVNGLLSDVENLTTHDLVSLSNIFDWMDTTNIKETIKLLKTKLASGTCILLRQINHDTPLEEMFGESFSYEKNLSQELLSKDRSLFYSKITVLRKV